VTFHRWRRGADRQDISAAGGDARLAGAERIAGISHPGAGRMSR